LAAAVTLIAESDILLHTDGSRYIADTTLAATTH
jgi:hypothetical protein